jgi:hypothetical protein
MHHLSPASRPLHLRGEAAPAAPDPLGRLRSEHARLLQAAREVESLLSRRLMDEEDRALLEENMRALRAMLPRHLVSEERALYPEIEEADPASGPLLASTRRRHLEVEKEFTLLQGLALSRCVEPEGGRDQRKAAHSGRVFREQLEALIALKEEGPFALAARVLAPSSLERVANAIEAAELREDLKRVQGR